MSSRDQRRVRKFYLSFLSNLRKWLVRLGSPFRISRKFIRNLMRQGSTSAQAGFILPTVVFVTVATTLLVLAVVARSADRAQSAANARVEQVFEVATSPIIDRARTKIEALLNDENLPRTTPPEAVLQEIISGGNYTYADETRLQIVEDFGTTTTVSTPSPNTFLAPGSDGKIRFSDVDIFDQEFNRNVWKFPIDTDNNGLFDSYGIYSILFRTRPPQQSDGSGGDDRSINTLEARTLPFDESGLSGLCQGAGGVTVATNEGWTLRNNRLKKAFYVYAASVPITDASSFPPGATNFETYRGIPSINALELQQDRARNPLNNNAAWFEGDLEIARPARFRFNGRMYTGGNLMIGALRNDDPIQLYQVSSSGTDPADQNKFGSCYYDDRNNSEINVAGNVVEGDALTTDTALEGAVVDLNRGPGVELQSNLTPAGDSDQPPLNDTNRTVQNTGAQAALNEFELNRRITVLVDAAFARADLTGISRPPSGGITLNYASVTKDPPSVQKDLIGRIRDEGIFGPGPLLNKARRLALQTYFRARVRKVPFLEVAFGVIPTPDPSPLLTPVTIPAPQGGGEDLAPPIEWAIPGYKNPGVLKTASGVTSATDFDGNGVREDANGLTLTPPSGTSLVLRQKEPKKLESDRNVETFIGDRVRVGNALPNRYIKKDGANIEFVGEKNQSFVANPKTAVKFDDPNTEDRFRVTQSFILDNLGELGRGGFWELSAADDPSNGNAPPNETPITGGLRVITNAGIYSPRPEYTFLPRFRTGLSDNSTTNDIDESAAPLWNGQPIDNPITIDDDDPNLPATTAAIRATTSTDSWAINEATFAAPDPTTSTPAERAFNESNYVVWPDSMPMTGQMRYFPYTPPGGLPVVAAPGGEAGWYPFEVNAVGTVVPFTIDANGERVDEATSTPADRARARNWRGNLQMRASAIYHYKYDAFNPEELTAASISADAFQAPVACVSSYYDPTTPETARNVAGLPWNTTDFNGNQRGRSNNGIVYPAPTTTAAGISGVPAFSLTTDKFAVSADASKVRDSSVPLVQRLAYQANLVFPNGRFVNEPLRNVLRRIVNGGGSALSARLSVAEQSTLDANICALQILDGTLSPETTLAPVVNGVTIPQGTFKEGAFLDAREVKALNKDESLLVGVRGYQTALGPTKGLLISSPNRADIYDLETEQRQPLEVRTTDLDIDRMRGATVTGAVNSGVATEYLLPYSGLVYATREDALPDLSYFDFDTANNTAFPTLTSTRKALSSTDFRLDPTRKVSGIRLINGYRLFRGTIPDTNKLDDPTGNVLGTVAISSTSQPAFSQATRGEKGLTLVSDTPVYVKAQKNPAGGSGVGFNVHTQQEFKTTLVEDIANPENTWSNFYKRLRSDLNPNFACRPGQNTNCTTGDEWRPATILADAATVLSGEWRDGYRSDGDFDARNNANTSTSINWISTLNPPIEQRRDSVYTTDRRKQGLFNNNFVTSANWLSPRNSDNQTAQPAAPTANVNFPQGNLASYNGNGVTPVQRRGLFEEYGMEICRRSSVEDCTFSDWTKIGGGTTVLPNYGGVPTAAAPYGPSGTPFNAPRFIAPEDTKFPRRVSFLRYDDMYKDGNQSLVFSQLCPGVRENDYDRQAWPIVIGVRGDGNSSNGITYPQTLDAVPEPYSGVNRASYGDIPCSQVAIIDIDQSEDQLEGREADNVYTNTPGVPNPLPTVTAANLASLINDSDTTSPPPFLGERPYRPYNGQIVVRNIGRAPATIVGAKLTFNGGTATPGAFGTNAPVGNGLGTDPVGIAGTDYIQKFYVRTAPSTASRCFISSAAATTGTNATALPLYSEIPDGSTIYFNKNAYAPCQFMVLGVRDNANENNETINIRLDNPTPPALSVRVPGGVVDDETFNIQISGNSTTTVDEPVPTGATVFNPNVCLTPAELAAGFSASNPVFLYNEPTGVILSTSSTTDIRDDRVVTLTTNVRQLRRVRKADCSSGTPSSLEPPTFGTTHPPTFSMGSNTMPFSAMLPFGASYPFVPNPTAATPTNNYAGFNLCNDPSTSAPSITGGYQCNQPDLDTADGTPIFPGLVAPRPNSVNSILPMLPGMRDDLPDQRDRALWFRTAENSGDVIGADDRVDHRRGRKLLVYNHSWPFFRGVTNDYRANLSHGKRLQLPETVCIQTNGIVDPNCLLQGNNPAQGDATAPAGLANLNLPYNPSFPAIHNVTNDSNNRNTGGTLATRRRGVTDATVQPASSYAVCGATGNSRAIQLDQSETQDFTSTGTGETCPAAQIGVINDFRTKLLGLAVSPVRNPSAPTINPGDVVIEGSPSTNLNTFGSDVTITATNTFATNRVHVISINALSGGSNILRGTLTLRANRDSVGRQLGPSPVFVFQAPNAPVNMEGLKIKLDGVEPNNIFWVFQHTGRTTLTIAGTLANPSDTSDVDKSSILVGNFIGLTPAAPTPANSSGLNIGLLKNTSPFALVDKGNDNGVVDLGNPDYFPVTFRGVRFLGFRADLYNSTAGGRNPANSADGIGINPNTVAASMTSVDEPVVLPVLQVHAPARTDTNATNRMPEFSPGSYNPNSANILLCSMNGVPANSCPGGVGGGAGGQWTMRANRTTLNPNNLGDGTISPVEVNVYFVAGNSPSRSGVEFTTSITARFPGFGVARNSTANKSAEVTGGLPNFVRLLENWRNVPLRIAGGFIQNTRSTVATGPFSQTAPYATTNSSALNYASDMQTLWINRFDDNRADQRLSSFRPYPATVTSESIPYYSPPLRLFGFDVGLLTQTADLFSSRFSTPINTPDEFFRETDAEDKYVKQLLCALETDDPVDDRTGIRQSDKTVVAPLEYKIPTLKGKDLPRNCDSVTGVSGYNPTGTPIPIVYE